MATINHAGPGQGRAAGSGPVAAAPAPLPRNSSGGGPRHDLDALFRAEAPHLVRYFARRLGAQEALDLTQETFLRFASQPRDATLAKPGAYLQRIARNLLINRAKNVSAAQERGHLPLEPELHAANDADPHQALVARQTLERYEAALMDLKPKTREIFLRHRLDGISYEQIAHEWNMSISGIEKQMMKAIAHIDRHLSRR